MEQLEKANNFVCYKSVAYQHTVFEQNGWHFSDDICKCILLSERICHFSKVIQEIVL